ncbi:unnamed protein product, partial [marine sediment metagenome]
MVYIDEGSIRKVNKDLEERLPDFKGGFAGYFSYDLKNYIEELPQNASDDINLPIFYLAYYDRLFAYGHQDSRWYYVRNFLTGEKKEENKGACKTAFPEDDYM